MPVSPDSPAGCYNRPRPVPYSPGPDYAKRDCQTPNPSYACESDTVNCHRSPWFSITPTLIHLIHNPSPSAISHSDFGHLVLNAHTPLRSMRFLSDPLLAKGPCYLWVGGLCQAAADFHVSAWARWPPSIATRAYGCHCPELKVAYLYVPVSNMVN
jgi:hypothetical protein